MSLDISELRMVFVGMCVCVSVWCTPSTCMCVSVERHRYVCKQFPDDIHLCKYGFSFNCLMHLNSFNKQQLHSTLLLSSTSCQARPRDRKDEGSKGEWCTISLSFDGCSCRSGGLRRCCRRWRKASEIVLRPERTTPMCGNNCM